MKKTKVEIRVKENLNKIKDNFKTIKLNLNKVKEKIKNNLKDNKGKGLNKQNVKYYSILIFMIIIAVVSTYLNILDYQKANTEKYAKHELIEKDILANSSNVVSNKTEELNNVNNIKSEEVIESNNTTYQTAISSISTSIKNGEYILPVNGKVVKEYSQNSVVYYQDLGIWKIHPGIDIKCDEDTPVICVLDGKVVGIYQDEVFGLSIVVECDEYTTVYSSLESVLVKIGEKIHKNDQIGIAGINAAEQNEGVHLHFELMENGEYIDPAIIGIK